MTTGEAVAPVSFLPVPPSLTATRPPEDALESDRALSDDAAVTVRFRPPAAPSGPATSPPMWLSTLLLATALALDEPTPTRPAASPMALAVAALDDSALTTMLPTASRVAPSAT